jgi:hypothetical protein
MGDSMTLWDIADNYKDDEAMKKFIAMSILRDSNVLDKLPFVNNGSLQVEVQYWQKLPDGGTWRAFNGAYSVGGPGKLASTIESLYGFGGDITYDARIGNMTNLVRDPVQLQIEGATKVMTLQWNDKFINGDVGTDPYSFDGIKKRNAAMPSRQMLYWTSATNAAPLDPTASAANARRFLNTARKARTYCNNGQVSACFCNEDFILGLSSAVIYLQSTGNYLDVTKDNLERETTTFMGIPMLDMGYQSDLTTEIITTTETAGDGGADSTSQYWVDINQENGVYGVQLNPFNMYDPLNGGEMESKPSRMMRVDWWNGLVSMGTRCIVRTRNLARLADWTEA